MAMKYTEWHPCKDVMPVRKGWYEVRHEEIPETIKRMYFDGYGFSIERHSDSYFLTPLRLLTSQFKRSLLWRGQQEPSLLGKAHIYIAELLG